MDSKLDNDDETVELTPAGLMSLEIGSEETRWVCDALELYMRRHGVGIAIDPEDNVMKFVKLVKEETT